MPRVVFSSDEEWGGEPVLSYQEHEDGSLEVRLPGGEARTYEPGTWELYVPQLLGRLPLVRLRPDGAASRPATDASAPHSGA
jgi:hypothetical protein